MLKRIALVVWWLGTLWLAMAVLGAVAALFALSRNSLEEAGFIFLSCGIPGMLCWAIAFILGGSFRRPPRIG